MSKYLAWVWAAFIFAASATPGHQLPKVSIDYFDKFAHLVVYAVLTFLVLHASVKNYSDKKAVEILKSQKNTISWALVLTALYGVAIEIIQGTLLPGRYFEFSDIIANIMGNLVGALLFMLYIKYPVFNKTNK